MSDEQKEEELSRAERGQTKGRFFELNFAQCITIAAVVIGLIGSAAAMEWTVSTYGHTIEQTSKDLTDAVRDMKSGFEQANKRMQNLEDRVNDININGTKHGQDRFTDRASDAATTNTRFLNLEASNVKLHEELAQEMSVVSGISTNMDWISGWVKAQMQQPPDHLGKNNSR